MGSIWPAIGTEQRARITATLLADQSEKPVRQLAKRLKVSPSEVTKTRQILHAAGLIRRGRPDLSKPQTRALKRLFNIQTLERAGVTRILRSNFKTFRGAGLYGSYAYGTNDERSDIDLWVRVRERDGMELVGATHALEEKLGRDIQLKIIDDKDLTRMEKSEDPFYHSLYFASELLEGERIDESGRMSERPIDNRDHQIAGSSGEESAESRRIPEGRRKRA